MVGLVSFTAKLTGQHKQDVLYSTLLAQLAANKKHNRFDDSKQWYEYYTDVLGNLGWVMQNFHFDEYESHQADFKISQVTLELLSAMIGGEAELLAVVKATLDSLAKSSEGITLFGSSSSSGKSGNFQIMPCTLDKSNQITVTFLGSYFPSRSCCPKLLLRHLREAGHPPVQVNSSLYPKRRPLFPSRRKSYQEAGR